jgi:hypothetical protein
VTPPTDLPDGANQCAIFVEVVPREGAFCGKIGCAEKLISQVRSINSPVSRSALKIFLFRFSELCDCLRVIPPRSEGRTRRHGR